MSDIEPECKICSKFHNYHNDYEECDKCLEKLFKEGKEYLMVCVRCEKVKYKIDLYEGHCWCCELIKLLKN